MEPFELSQPTISKHLKVLEHAGLIEGGRQAQRRPRRLAPFAMKDVADWIEPFRQQWERRFNNLETHLATRNSKRRNEMPLAQTADQTIGPLIDRGHHTIRLTRDFERPARRSLRRGQIRSMSPAGGIQPVSRWRPARSTFGPAGPSNSPRKTIQTCPSPEPIVRSLRLVGSSSKRLAQRDGSLSRRLAERRT